MSTRLCNQEGCGAAAVALFQWPGREVAGICEAHKETVHAVARALGMPIAFFRLDSFDAPPFDPPVVAPAPKTDVERIENVLVGVCDRLDALESLANIVTVLARQAERQADAHERIADALERSADVDEVHFLRELPPEDVPQLAGFLRKIIVADVRARMNKTEKVTETTPRAVTDAKSDVIHEAACAEPSSAQTVCCRVMGHPGKHDDFIGREW